MNNLGGMVFIVAGIALGYWVLTGRAVNFMKALNQGTGYGSNPIPSSPGQPGAGSAGGWNPITTPNSPITPQPSPTPAPAPTQGPITISAPTSTPGTNVTNTWEP